MIGKLAGHSMFQGAAAERLKMCGDCRVIDLHSDPAEVADHRSVTRDRTPAIRHVRHRCRRRRARSSRAPSSTACSRAVSRAADAALLRAVRGRGDRGARRRARSSRRRWQALVARCARPHATSARGRVRRAVPRRRQARGVPLRLVLPRRLPQREAAGRAARRPGRARPGRAPRRCTETEDHVACLFEVMRYLIAGDDVAVSNLEPAALLRRHLRPWVGALCDAMKRTRGRDFYRPRGRIRA